MEHGDPLEFLQNTLTSVDNFPLRYGLAHLYFNTSLTMIQTREETALKIKYICITWTISRISTIWFANNCQQSVFYIMAIIILRSTWHNPVLLQLSGRVNVPSKKYWLSKDRYWWCKHTFLQGIISIRHEFIIWTDVQHIHQHFCHCKGLNMLKNILHKAELT